MGINGLWSILAPAAETQSLKDYTLAQSILHGEKNGVDIKPITVGIDASIWLHQCQTIFNHRHHSQMGQNPELRVLFYRLSALLNCSMVPVFVFDGCGRPTRKRGKAVRLQENWMVKKFKDLIEAFGFHWHQAPGEAEAELAFLNAQKVFHAIMTEDSDSFVFGATNVIRRANGLDKKTDQIKIYSAERCETISSISLTRPGFVLVALLRGGDYNNGLRGCGINTAHKLAKLSSLGDSLTHAVMNLSSQNLSVFLQEWRTSLREELSTNKNGYLEQRHSVVATSIPHSFPDIAVINNYINPIVSYSEGVPVRTVDGSEWELRLPELDRLFRICNHLFSWGAVHSVLKKFKGIFWNGFCLRQLLLFGLGDAGIAGGQLTEESFSHARLSKRRGPIRSQLVDVNLQEVLESFFPLPESERKALLDEFSNFTAALPTKVIAAALPHLMGNMTGYLKKTSRNTMKNTKGESREMGMKSLGFIDLTREKTPQPQSCSQFHGKKFVSLGFLDLTKEEDHCGRELISLGTIDLTCTDDGY